MKNHLKRIAAPRTWMIGRKDNKFIVRPKPGAHSLSMGLPLGVVLRDNLKLAPTIGEIKKILNRKDILVDGKRRKDHHFIVGLFDLISIPDLKKSYRVLLDSKGRLIVSESSEEESKLKLCKITGKSLLAKGKIQYHLHDGKNIISENKSNVGDTFVLQLPELTIKQVLSLKENNTIFLLKGKHGGDSGKLKEINGDVVTYTNSEGDIETAKEYVFVVGEKKPVITLNK